jgi:hypothetical protein
MGGTGRGKFTQVRENRFEKGGEAILEGWKRTRYLNIQ